MKKNRREDVHDLSATAKGSGLKLGCHHEVAEFVRCRIVEHKGLPDVIAHRKKLAGMEIVASAGSSGRSLLIKELKALRSCK